MPDKRVYTWRKTHLKHGRLDHILISESLSNSVKSYSINPGYRSDHSIETSQNIANNTWKQTLRIHKIVHF